MKYTPEQLEEKMSQVPEDIKEAVISTEVGETLTAIGEKNKLHVDQIGALAEEVGLVMIGLVRPKDFIGSISRKLKIKEDLAREITREINEKIFNPIKESLKQVHAMNGGQTKTESSRQTGQIFDQKMQSLIGFGPGSSKKDSADETRTPGENILKNLKDPYREPVE